MWEEHPAYQKAQAGAIGISLILLFIAGVVYCVSERDWHSLSQVLRYAGGLVVCLVLLSLTARLVIKVLTRKRDKDTEVKS